MHDTNMNASTDFNNQRANAPDPNSSNPLAEVIRQTIQNQNSSIAVQQELKNQPNVNAGQSVSQELRTILQRAIGEH